MQNILEQFGLEKADYQPLSNTENTNYCVTTANGKKYLLRQHQSKHSLNALESEMIWLTHLHQQGLEVQKPLPVSATQFILSFESNYYSVLTWLEGEVIEEINPAQAAKTGELMAQLHQIALAYQNPIGFERPQYDVGYLEKTMQSLREIPWLKQDIPLLEAANQQAKQVFRFQETPKALIHADLHPGNLLFQASQVKVIDFDRCGFGPLAFDLVTALGYLEDDAQITFLEGYSKLLPLPTGFSTYRELFSIAAWLTNIAFLAARAAERDYLETIMLPALRQQIPKILEVPYF
jgi:Ser/Thr protein kinase RdoA (MazF antagonist)